MALRVLCKHHRDEVIDLTWRSVTGARVRVCCVLGLSRAWFVQLLICKLWISSIMASTLVAEKLFPTLYNGLKCSPMTHSMPLFLSSPPPPSDGVFVRPGPPRVTSLHQPPGTEDHPNGTTARPLWLAPPRSGWLGDPQGPQRQTLLLQPLHSREDLEAAASQGHQHGPRGSPQHRRKHRGKGHTVGGAGTHYWSSIGRCLNVSICQGE